MKKITGILTAAAIAAGAAPAYARSGDVAGQYYSTDIRTYVNGYEISTINIGGQTLISAEDMEYYSFSVYWDGEAGKLYIDRTAHEMSGPPPEVTGSDKPSGAVLGNYYETDIVTYLDGKPITAYNVGGRTYIHAEQMRDRGYVVDWNETDKTLSVTSPDRAGYEYSMRLSQGRRPDTEEFGGDGEGAFAIAYENGKLTGCGDAALFGSALKCDGTRYTISMGFYQHEGLFFSRELLGLLYSLYYSEYGNKIAEPEEKYALIGENVSIIINGNKAENVKVTKSGGNGHTDFEFEITDIPMYREEEINSVYFSVGNTEAMEMHNIEFSENRYDEVDEIVKTLKRYPDDFMQSAYYADNYTAVYMCESPSMGVIKDRLYIIDNETKKCSEDLLEQVRRIEGFDSDVLRPFAFKEGDIKSHFFFSCASAGRSGDFYADTKTGTVYAIGLSNIRNK